MSRGDLERLENHWSTFTGEFVRYGSMKCFGTLYSTVLLQNICHNGVKVADHMWFIHSPAFVKVGTLYEGEIIKFDARVGRYLRGYVGGRLSKRALDFMLQSPSNIEVIESRLILMGGE